MNGHPVDTKLVDNNIMPKKSTSSCANKSFWYVQVSFIGVLLLVSKLVPLFESVFLLGVGHSETVKSGADNDHISHT